MIGPESLPRRMERVVMQRVDDQAILLQADTGRYYALNEVSGRIWELCDGSHSVSAIAAAVCREYDASAPVVEEDVRNFLEEMAAERLVILA